MLLGYARVSTTHQDLERQIVALTEAGVAPKWIFADKKSGSGAERDGLKEVTRQAREGDTIVVVTLDRLARNLRDTLNLIHALSEERIGIKTLKDPIPIDTSSDDAMARISVLMLGLFAEMERVWNAERVAHARSKAGRSPGRPKVLTPERVAMAAKMQAGGESIRAIADAMQVSKTTLQRALAQVAA